MKQIATIILVFISLTSFGQGSKYTVKGNGSSGSNVGDSVKKNTDTLVVHKGLIYPTIETVNSNKLVFDSTLTFPYAPTDSTYILGTSIVVGYGLANTSNSFIGSLGRYYNKSFSNYGLSASAIRYAYYQMSLNKRDLVSYPILTDAYFNNVRKDTALTPRYNTARAGMRAIAALNWLQNIQFIYSGVSGTLNSNVTFSSLTGWGGAGSEAILLDYGSRTYWYRHNSAAQAGCNMAIKTSTVANETMTITNVSGSGIAIGTWGCVTGYSRIQYAVDGVTIGTYNPVGQTYAANTDGGTTAGVQNDAIIITGLKDTIHTVVLTFLDGSLNTRIDYVGGLISPYSSKNIPIYILDAYHMSNSASIGYNYPGNITTATVMDSASYYVRQNMAASFPGYSFGYVPTNRYYDPQSNATQVQSDGIHPTVLGDTKILNAITDIIGKSPLNNSMASAITGTPYYFPIFSGTTAIGNSVWQQDATSKSNNGSNSYNGGFDISVSNPSTGTGAVSRVLVGNNNTADYLAMGFYGSNYTTFGVLTAKSGLLFSAGTGGFNIINSSTAPTRILNACCASANVKIRTDYNLGVTIGADAAAAASAVLDVPSTTQGFLPPRMTTAQRNAISSPATGLTLYCTDCTATDASTGVMQTYNGSGWKNNW